MPDADRQRIFPSHHNAATLHKWARALRHFRFCNAAGGQANDGDSFRCLLEFQGEAGLLEVCRQLSLSLAHLPPDTPRPVPGKSYSWTELRQFSDPIEAYPWHEQPGRTTLFEVPVFAWVGRETVGLELSGAGGDSYEVTAADFRNAKRLEDQFHQLSLEFRDPPVDDSTCLCPKFWPEFFTGEPG